MVICEKCGFETDTLEKTSSGWICWDCIKEQHLDDSHES